jgi:hypothetical protein
MPSPPSRPLNLLLLIALVGCGSPASVSPTATATTTPTLNGYWQFQSTASTPPGATLLSGAFQTQGSLVAGIFIPSIGCTPSVVTFSAPISTSGAVSLVNPYANLQLQLPSSASAAGTATGAVSGGGYLCNAVLGNTPVTGTEIAAATAAPLTGTFTGNITPSPANVSPDIVSGAVSLTLTQSSSLNSLGQFPLTGTLTFTSGTCTSTTTLTGALAGVWVTLASPVNPPAGQASLSITAAANPAGTQLIGGEIAFTPNPCASSSTATATYIGVLSQ